MSGVRRSRAGRVQSVLCAAIALAAGDAQALNMTVGDVVVRNLGDYGFTAANSVLSFDGGAIDQLYQMYGYLGNANGMVAVNGASFDVLSAISASGGQATSVLELDPAGAAALGLAAGDLQIQYTFRAIDDASARDWDGFEWDIALTNTTASAIDVVFYGYLDLDIGGSGDFGDDLVDADLQRMVVRDASPGTTDWFTWRASGGGSADHFQVGTYPSVRDTLDGMATAQDLSDAAASFGPGDFTGAFQYTLSLAPGATVNLSTGGLQAVPEPAAAVLLASGLAALGAGRRRRRSLPLRP